MRNVVAALLVAVGVSVLAIACGGAPEAPKTPDAPKAPSTPSAAPATSK